MKHLLVLCGVIGLTTPLGSLIANNNSNNIHNSSFTTDGKNYLTPDYYGITVRLFINHQTWGVMWNEYRQDFNIKPPFEIANDYANIISKFPHATTIQPNITTYQRLAMIAYLNAYQIQSINAKGTKGVNILIGIFDTDYRLDSITLQ